MTAHKVVAWAFAASAVGSAGLIIVYALGGDAQIEGILLAISLGGLGVGIGLWGTDLMVSPEETEERPPLPSSDEDRAELDVAFGSKEVTRRSLLVRLLGAAVAALGAALAVPSLSLGPQPGSSLFRTRWRSGARVVDSTGRALRPADIPFDSVITAFPQGAAGNADSQTLLLRIDPGLLRLSPERMGWVPEGVVGYSKICTHAGCPVGLYRVQARELLCPCHQSTFDVLRGAAPIFGPAARPLPQLPLAVDDEGFLISTDDFPEPVGPSFWNMTRGDDA